MLKNTVDNILYLNNDINSNQFNQLYNPKK